MRLVAQGDREHFFGRGHFKIERQDGFAAQPFDVVVRDMTAVLAQVGSDSVGAGLRGQARGAYRIGVGPAARVTNGGDVVDVHAES